MVGALVILLLTLGAQFSQPTDKVQAAAPNLKITQVNGLVNSRYITAPVYTDFSAKTPTGQKLSIGVSLWRATAVAKTSNGVDYMYNLGRNQWVKAKDLIPDLTINPNVEGTMAYSYNKPVPIYSNPQLTQPTGKTLATNIKLWQINRITYFWPSYPTYAYDLGNNQWVAAKYFAPIEPITHVYVGKAMMNMQDINHVASFAKTDGYYKVVDVASLSNADVYAKIGTDSQWVYVSMGALAYAANGRFRTINP
ncbi:hypothetical protein FC83_GL001732 [Agrilactobacillus composti DSM 18527 = JCM 14202]|uniref:Surface layer protein A domain-containing protein n=1 Tax=Agrilactobacillus composti DSM 18527 = JCM 14202 TaxID=1423734 RepID=A0A0R1XPP8_9LACO|nr:hypothetical protein FC83_GL001732 [Agrilactobacillus composti DSM 18527 = JCM 14202]